MESDKNKKNYVQIAQVAMDIFKKTKDKAILFDDTFLEENELYIKALVDLNILESGKSGIYYITSYTQQFIDNKGLTEDDLKYEKEDRRSDLSVWISGVSIILSICSLVVSLIALTK